MTTLRLLGGASIEDPDGTVLTGPAAQPRRLALLAVLATVGGIAVSRERLVAILWPESTPDRARHLLADNLYVINRELEGDPVEAAGDGLRLNPAAVTSDIALFEAALSSGEPDRAVELYGGPFLDGFFLRGSVEFDDWSRFERERLERLHREALVALAEAAPDPGTSAAWWRRLVASDPYNARWRTGSMEALARSGNRAGALAEARAHAALLAAEFDAEPERSVEALAERIKGGELASDEVPGRVEREPAVSSGSASSAPRSSRFRRRMTIPVALSVVGIAGFVLFSAERAGLGSRSLAERPARSIAVLPLENLSGDPGQEYLADGMTEEIIGHLAKIEGLTVISRTTAMRYRDTEKSLREIARELGVTTILEGSVRREADRVRVTAQLVDAASDAHLWAESYDRDIESVLALQGEVATAIAQALEIELSPVERARIDRVESTSGEAHRLYLRGRYFLARRNPEDLRRAVALFEQATDIDPTFAAAHAAVADVHSVQLYLGWSDDPGPMRRRMEERARRALELDPANGTAYAALAALAEDKWEWAEAEGLYRRALEMNPGNERVPQQYANYLQMVGRPAEAVSQAERAHELDPQSMIALVTLTKSYVADRRYPEAIETARRAAEMSNESMLPHLSLVLALERAGRFEEAIEPASRTAAIRFGEARGRELRSRLVSAWSERGRRGYWEVMAPFYEEITETTGPRRATVARLALGDREAALDLLERGLEKAKAEGRSHNLFFDPGLDPLRDDPRFRQLLAWMGLE